MCNYKANPLRTQSPTMEVDVNNHLTEILSVDWHKGGENLITSNNHAEIRLYSVRSLLWTIDDTVGCLIGHSDEVTEAHFCKDGFGVFSGSLDRTVILWDTDRGIQKDEFLGHERAVNTVQCSPVEANMLASGASDKTIRIWDVRQRDSTAILKSHHGVSSVCFSACGKYLFNGGFGNGDIVGWDMRQNDIVQLFGGHSDAVTGVSVSPTGKYLASVAVDGTLRKWDLSSFQEAVGECQIFQVGPSDLNQLRRCAWSPNERYLSTGGPNNNVLVYDASTGGLWTELPGHSDVVTDVAFHPLKRRIMSAGIDGYIILNKV